MAHGLEKLLPWFDRYDVDPGERPGHFAFVVPSLAGRKRWPDYPIAATPEGGRAAGGRGLTTDGCWASGLGEAIEWASIADWPDDEVYVSSADTAVVEPLDLTNILGFSPEQVASRCAWNEAHIGVDWCPQPYASNAEIAWCKAYHAWTGIPRLIPADYVYLRPRTSRDPNSVAFADSAGCAAGPTPDAARASALLELFERDAIGRWWYGARRRFALDLKSAALPGSLQDYISAGRRSVRLIDISTDLWSPVIAAASWEPDGTHVALGFAAKPTWQEAIDHALIEMLQIEIANEQLMAIDPDEALIWCRQNVSEMPSIFLSTELKSVPAATGKIPDPLHESVSKCRDNEIDVYFMDRSRSEFGVPVIRAIATDLCRDKPRWGPKRLLESDPYDIDPVGKMTNGLPPNPIPLRI